MSEHPFDINELEQHLERVDGFGDPQLAEVQAYVDDLDAWLAARSGDAPIVHPDFHVWKGGLHHLQGHLAYVSGDVDAATKLYEQAVASSKITGDMQREVRGLRCLALCYEYSGRQTESIDCVFRALRLAEASGDQLTLAKALNGLLALYESQGAYQQALQTSERLHKTANELNDDMLLATACASNGLFLGYLNRPEEGLPWIDEAIALASGSEFPLIGDYARLYQAWLFGLAGRTDEAVAAAESQLKIIAGLPAPNAAATYVDVAEIYVAAGKLEQATDMLHKADEVADGERLKGHLIRYFQVAADLHEARGETTLALKMLRRFVELEAEIRGEQSRARLLTVERQVAAELAAKAEKLDHVRAVELREKNDQLQALIQQNDEILRVVVHDLRNPLAATQLLSESLLIDLAGDVDEDAVERLDSIGSAAIEMRATVDTLLDTQNSVRPRMVMSITAAVQHAVDHARTISDGCAISTAIDDAAADLLVNGALLRRSLGDLLSYAIEGSGEPSTLSVDVASTSSTARITIVGHHPCSTTFWNDSRLYIARRLIERMQGSMTLSSPADANHPAATIDLRF